MSPTVSGLMIVACLFVLLATGMPIAFALGLAAFAALYMQSGAGIFYVLGDTMFSGIANLAYVSIPMFVLMGAAVASSPAGSDLYTSLDRWLNRIPGGAHSVQYRSLRHLLRHDWLFARDLRGDRQNGHSGNDAARLSRFGRERLHRRRRHAGHSHSPPR